MSLTGNDNNVTYVSCTENCSEHLFFYIQALTLVHNYKQRNMNSQTWYQRGALGQQDRDEYHILRL